MWIYHICKGIWEAAPGKTLVYVEEPGDSGTTKVLAAEKDEEDGHLP